MSYTANGVTFGDKDSLYYCLDIIATVLKVDRNNLWKYEPNANIPKDSGIYFAASEVSAVNYATNSKKFDDNGTTKEQISVLMREVVQIDVFSTQYLGSYIPSVIGVFGSTYAQQIQELNQFHISKVQPAIADNTTLDGQRALFQKSITLTILRKYDTINTITTFDETTFELGLLTEKQDEEIIPQPVTDPLVVQP